MNDAKVEVSMSFTWRTENALNLCNGGISGANKWEGFNAGQSILKLCKTHPQL